MRGFIQGLSLAMVVKFIEEKFYQMHLNDLCLDFSFKREYKEKLCLQTLFKAYQFINILQSFVLV